MSHNNRESSARAAQAPWPTLCGARSGSTSPGVPLSHAGGRVQGRRGRSRASGAAPLLGTTHAVHVPRWAGADRGPPRAPMRASRRRGDRPRGGSRCSRSAGRVAVHATRSARQRRAPTTTHPGDAPRRRAPAYWRRQRGSRQAGRHGQRRVGVRRPVCMRRRKMHAVQTTAICGPLCGSEGIFFSACRGGCAARGGSNVLVARVPDTRNAQGGGEGGSGSHIVDVLVPTVHNGQYRTAT